MVGRRLFVLSALVASVTACAGREDTAPTTPATVTSDAGGTNGTDALGTDTTFEPTASDPDDTDGSSSPPSTEPPTTIAATTSSTTTSTTTTTTTTIPATTTTVPGQPPAVEAAAFVVFDTSRNTMLAQFEADTPRPVGSLIKLLTAHVAYAAGDPTRVVTAPDGLLLEDDESNIGIPPGQELSRDLLIRAMLKASANDAARMLAIDISGSEAAFAEQMNAAAAALGLANTRAVNATGLDADGQYSTANDVTRLGVLLMSNPSFLLAVRDPTAELNGQAFPNPNDLLGTYPGADGIKTGTTTGAGWCVLASATRENRRIVVAVLGAPTEAARDAAATALLDWGFAQP